MIVNQRIMNAVVHILFRIVKSIIMFALVIKILIIVKQHNIHANVDKQNNHFGHVNTLVNINVNAHNLN